MNFKSTLKSHHLESETMDEFLDVKIVLFYHRSHHTITIVSMLPASHTGLTNEKRNYFNGRKP
jgi:hypothetical protein